MVKLSILAFYNEIFGISIPFRRLNYAMVGTVVFFWLLFFLLYIFQCHPIHEMWNATSLLDSSKSSCMSKTPLLFSFDFTNLAVDLVMLVIPPTMIRQLQLPSHKKWSACGILLIGGV